jgi:hypothetical protein
MAVATEAEAIRLLRPGHTAIGLLIVDQCGPLLRHVSHVGNGFGPGREGVKPLYLTSFRSLAERVAAITS